MLVCGGADTAVRAVCHCGSCAHSQRCTCDACRPHSTYSKANQLANACLAPLRRCSRRWSGRCLLPWQLRRLVCWARLQPQRASARRGRHRHKPLKLCQQRTALVLLRNARMVSASGSASNVHGRAAVNHARAQAFTSVNQQSVRTTLECYLAPERLSARPVLPTAHLRPRFGVSTAARLLLPGHARVQASCDPSFFKTRQTVCRLYSGLVML